MGSWGVALFADDLAADVRADGRDLVLDGDETDAAAEQVLRLHSVAAQDPDQSTIFWLAFAAAQMETGRLQEAVKARALAIIEAGGDVARWRDEDPVLASQRQRVLDRLAIKLRGPQPKPKRLRRSKPLGLAFELGDVVRLRGPETGRQGLAVVVAHADGHPRGVVNPVFEFLVWDGSSLPTAAELQTLPTVMHVNTMLRDRPPSPRPYLWVVITAGKDQVFSPEHGEVVARGVQRAPSGDHRGATAVTEVGAGSTTWAGLCNYLDHLYQRDLQATLDALSAHVTTAVGQPLDLASFADAALAELKSLAPPGFIEGLGRDQVPVDLEEWGDTPAEAVENWLYGRLSGLQDDIAFETTEPWPASAEARRQPQPFVRIEDSVLHWGFELDGRVVLALRPLSIATLRFDQQRG